MIRSPAGFDGGDRIKRYLDYYQPSYGVMMLSAGQFSPAMLFAAGEQGAWYDPSDLTTMFQDAAGTTPVTAVGQPVGLILDKSGRGNHASQSTSTARPTYQSSGGLSYLAFDGTDDSMSTGTINPGSVDKAQVFAGVRKLSDAAAGVVAETTVNAVSVAGGFVMAASSVAGGANNLSWGGGANGLIEAYRTYTSPDTRVFSLALDSDTVPRITARLNGVAVSANSSSGTGGAGNFVSSPLYIGSRAGNSVRLNGNLYQLIVRFSATNLDAATITATDTWVNGKTGAY